MLQFRLQACSNINQISRLTSVSSKEEQDFILALPGIKNSSALFVGGTDAASEGTWAWLDHKPWTFVNFPSGEPNGDEKENCLEVVNHDEGDNRKAGWWNDIPCEENRGHSYVCAYDNGE